MDSFPTTSKGSKRRSEDSEQDPPRKQARQSPPTLPIQLGGQPSALPSVPLTLQYLRMLDTSVVDISTDYYLEVIYANAELYYQEWCKEQNIKADNLVDRAQFIVNVRQQESHFLEVFRKAMKANENDADMKAFLNHSTCLYCGMNQY
jgi:hypothetical protein